MKQYIKQALQRDYTELLPDREKQYKRTPRNRPQKPKKPHLRGN